MPHGHRHPLSIMTELATDVFVDMGYTLVDGVEDAPEIENDYYCFEALNCPKDHPARDMQVQIDSATLGYKHAHIFCVSRIDEDLHTRSIELNWLPDRKRRNEPRGKIAAS